MVEMAKEGNTMNEEKKPTAEPVRAIAWQNGMLMVFDRHGHQVPEYQGETSDMRPKLMRDWPKCEIKDGVWR